MRRPGLAFRGLCFGAEPRKTLALGREECYTSLVPSYPGLALLLQQFSALRIPTVASIHQFLSGLSGLTRRSGVEHELASAIPACRQIIGVSTPRERQASSLLVPGPRKHIASSSDLRWHGHPWHSVLDDCAPREKRSLTARFKLVSSMATTQSNPASTSPTTPVSATTGLRRSCIFCRARKIRCSGGHICSACRERNINCVYGPEARKGRPRRKPSGLDRSQRLSPSTSNPGDAESGVTTPTRRHQSPLDTERTLGMDLEQMFTEYFIEQSGSRSNLFQNSIAAFHRQMGHSSPSHPSPEPRPRLHYEGLLSFLAHDMVEMLLGFSSLGCERPPAANRSFYITSLAADTTHEMFDSPRTMKNPLPVLGKYRVLQMVDLWFSMHPLSPVVSKTLLISEIKDETVDPALLAIILADACQVHHGPQTRSRERDGPGADQEDPDTLIRFAASHLRRRAALCSESDPLSTAQALLLLGWRELCLGNARRGTCYVGYTCRIVSRLHKMWGDESSMEVDSIKLNGIDIGSVKREILQNIYWLCLSTTTWSFMQINQPFSLLLPEEIPDFPSMDESLSPSLRLDRASDNISTLQGQTRTMQWLWPLSHITSTVAHIYTLFLNVSGNDEAPRTEIAPWQTQHIHELHHLPQACFDPSVLSRHIRRILLQAIQAVEREVTHPPSQSFLLTAYHTIVIHMLFARHQRCRESLRVRPVTVHAFLQSAAALLAIAQRSPHVDSSPVASPRMMSDRGADVTRTLALGLDTCSRTLAHIHGHSHQWMDGGDEVDAAAILAQLADFAHQMHQICKGNSLLSSGPVIRPVKKRFKQLKQAFSTSPSPTDGRSLPTSVVAESASPLSVSIADDAPPLVAGRSSGISLTHSAASPSPALSDCPAEVMDSYFFLGDPDMGSLLGLTGFIKPGPGPRVDLSPSRSSPTAHPTQSHTSTFPSMDFHGRDILLFSNSSSTSGQVSAGVQSVADPYGVSFPQRAHQTPVQTRHISSDSLESAPSESDIASLYAAEKNTVPHPWTLPSSWLEPFGTGLRNETDGIFRS
ncbi:Zn(II)2Cys6 transcription factor [Aspergillus affinis]|uniref:Zn(II)2Cys6 transcription factor n=1 Tax=Aspergillus affinis TaxID=1070780 RepID=UPI0022FEB85D|nr:uncharacterized protein KD926_005492 [Aspergillus affinis]KAI9042414.1 hypothetical protein KD926_005492 [Aspergillus affinis]